jgi:hypothetical protein
MTKIELDQAEAVCFCLPRIADSLESIAKSLERMCKQKEDCNGEASSKNTGV